MRRLSVVSKVLPSVALIFALIGPGQAPAEPLSLDTLTQKPPAQEEIPELKDAESKLQKGDLDGALADMKAAVKKRPNLPPAEVIMARIFAQSNQGGAVRYWLERAVVETPDDPEAYAMLGGAALQGQQAVESRLLFERAYQLLATFNGDAKRKEDLQAMTCGQLARLAMQRKEWDVAKGYLDELLKLRPDDNAALQVLARVLFEQGKVDEALEKLNAAKTADRELLTPEAIIAQWFQESAGGAKPDPKAGEYLVAAITRDGRDYKTRFVAANWAFQTQQFDQARKQAEYAIQLAKETNLDLDPPLTLAGTVAIFQGDYAAAEDYLRSASTLAPAKFNTTNNLALALCEQDNEAKKKLAYQYAQINARVYPKELEALSTLGRVLTRLGDYRAADEVFRKVITAGRPLSPDTVYYLADLYAKTDRKEQAKKWLEEVVKKEGLFSQRANAEKLLKELGS
ncbi:MAG: tetratricopeptide repeat protein [Pirellulales bacterium]|nr:tetratricopeptide repeat protein [Pirellulales bacterium]